MPLVQQIPTRPAQLVTQVLLSALALDLVLAHGELTLTILPRLAPSATLPVALALVLILPTVLLVPGQAYLSVAEV